MNIALTKIDFTDAKAVWRRNFRVYIRLWKTELIAPIIEPIFTFFAFGFGVDRRSENGIVCRLIYHSEICAVSRLKYRSHQNGER